MHVRDKYIIILCSSLPLYVIFCSPALSISQSIITMARQTKKSKPDEDPSRSDFNEASRKVEGLIINDKLCILVHPDNVFACRFCFHFMQDSTIRTF
jgi:hypothetical protein